MIGFGQLGTVGSDMTIVLPLSDSKTNGPASAIVGPKERKNAFRWFVRTPDLRDAEKFACPMGYDRRSIRFDPVLLYLDHPFPPRTAATIKRVVCGSETGKIRGTQLDQWTSTRETIHWPALEFEAPTIGPCQVLEFEGTSWWKKGPWGKTMDPWLKGERGPVGTEIRTLSVLCLFRMSWLPRETRSRFQFVDGSAVHRPPISVVAREAPQSVAPAPPEVEPPDQKEDSPLGRSDGWDIDLEPSSDE